MKVKFDADNLIQNRFDLIYGENVKYKSYTCGDDLYDIQFYIKHGISEVNIWGKNIPYAILEMSVQSIFANRENYAVRIVRGRSQYQSFLEITNDIRVPLPNNFEELMNRAERRDRATIRRKLRWLDERIGSLKIDVYAKDETPDSVVETYFKWKKESHRTDYGLSPREYLVKYYVTDSMLMRAGDTDVAVAFFCQVENIVFFENFSYNPKLKEYSPGLLMYVKMMEELINRKCKYLYLGGGGYIYKKRFGAEHSIAYSGTIYRQEIVDSLNGFFSDRGIKTVAFYGYGVCGHSFYQLSKNLDIEVVFGIDQGAEDNEEGDISLCLPDDTLPLADAGLITLNSENAGVEDYMKSHFTNVFYWNDVLEGVIDTYRKSVDACS